jgi:large-conductance mechanosensitive channel
MSQKINLMRAQAMKMLLQIGDNFAGAAIGAVTALVIRSVVSPGMDMVLAMLVGMALGMIVSLLMGYMLAPLIGIIDVMVPGSLTGMYGGMLFAMRDSMAAGSRTMAASIVVGAIFGLVVTAAVEIYNYALRGTVIEAGD